MGSHPSSVCLKGLHTLIAYLRRLLSLNDDALKGRITSFHSFEATVTVLVVFHLYIDIVGFWVELIQN